MGGQGTCSDPFLVVGARGSQLNAGGRHDVHRHRGSAGIAAACQLQKSVALPRKQAGRRCSRVDEQLRQRAGKPWRLILHLQ